jgi:hypothetical protein
MVLFKTLWALHFIERGTEFFVHIRLDRSPGVRPQIYYLYDVTGVTYIQAEILTPHNLRQ